MGEYLTTAELAKMLGIPEETIRFWRQAGRGPASMKLGRHVRYARTDVDAWLEAAKRVPA